MKRYPIRIGVRKIDNTHGPLENYIKTCVIINTTIILSAPASSTPNHSNISHFLNQFDHKYPCFISLFIFNIFTTWCDFFIDHKKNSIRTHTVKKDHKQFTCSSLFFLSRLFVFPLCSLDEFVIKENESVLPFTKDKMRVSVNLNGNVSKSQLNQKRIDDSA